MMKRFHAAHLLPLLLVALQLGACRTPGTTNHELPDYFSPQFHCTEGNLKDEIKSEHLAPYQLYREKRFRTEQKGIQSSYAVITGDSTSALFHDERLKKYLPDVEIVNRGIPGDTTALLLLRLQEDVLALKPSVIILAIGGNDILRGRCLSTTLANTAKIEAMIHGALPQTQLHLVSVPPVHTMRPNTITPYYNQQLARLASRLPNTHFVDLWPALAETDRAALAKQYWLKLPGGKIDSVHFNEEGYREWGKLLMPLFTQKR